MRVQQELMISHSIKRRREHGPRSIPGGQDQDPRMSELSLCYDEYEYDSGFGIASIVFNVLREYGEITETI